MRKYSQSVFVNGFFTGLVLQLAIGPIFFFIINIALQKTILDGLSAALAVTIVDYIYIILAILGVGKLLEKKRIKDVLGISGAVVLALFGVIMVLSVNNTDTGSISGTAGGTDYLSSFLSAFLLTISSPLTIVFWTSLFSAKAVEKGYTKQQLKVFGFSAGLTTIIFLGISVVVFSLLKASIPLTLIKVLNVLVGVLLILYGIIRFVKSIKNYGNELVPGSVPLEEQG